MNIELSPAEELRYNRQIVLPAVGFEGQEKLKASQVLIVGLGGLGCAASQYLAAAGVGHLILLDFDTVSISNLQRQVLHKDATVDMAKVESAKQALQELNPHIQITTICQQLENEALISLIENVNLVLDCTDNITTRNQLDYCCAQTKTALVSGAAIRMEGQVSVFNYEPNTPTYHDLSQFIGHSSLSCTEAGVLSPIVGIVGSIQALEAIKLLMDIGTSLCGRLLLIDGLNMRTHELKLPISPHPKAT